VHRLTRITAGLGVALALTIAGLTASIHTASAHGDVIGHVYVNDNTAGTNTIAAFDRHANGALTPLRGSPFAAGGAGSGTIIGTQGALQLSSDGRYLLAADAGSNQISVLRILWDGSLRPVAGSPVSSGGVEPISIAVHGGLVYVANDGATGANYTGFSFGADGRLTPLPNSTFALPGDSGPGDVLFNGDGTRLVGVRVNTSAIDSFAVGANGLLTAAPGSPFAAQAEGPFGSAFRPGHPSQLFVSNAHAGPGLGSVSAFRDGRDGTLTPIGASPYADNQTAPCWVDITPDGRYLFAVNTASSTVSRYSIAAGGTLTLLGSTPLANGAGLRPFDLRVAPDGRNAYVVEAGHATVGALAVNGGDLTELASSPATLPAGATPFGVVVS
jgi:6-phosphogluconolactonase (cycloisomerase 2 family)